MDKFLSDGEVNEENNEQLKGAGFTLKDGWLTRPDGTLVCLSPITAMLMAHFMRHPNKPMSALSLAMALWPGSASKGTAAVTTRNLRYLIEDDPSNPQWLITVWGWGYALVSDEAHREAIARYYKTAPWKVQSRKGKT